MQDLTLFTPGVAMQDLPLFTRYATEFGTSPHSGGAVAEMSSSSLLQPTAFGG